MSALKKAAKKVGRFVRKNWRKIVIAAAIVFTAGIATVGVAGFSSAMGAASAAGASSFGAFVSAAGSTMAAGVASIGGTLGIGQGVTAATAGGAFAGAPVMAGVASGAGLTLGTGAAAQGLGMAASTAAPAGISVGGGVSGGVGAGNAAGAANAARSGIQLGGGMSGGVGSSMGGANAAGGAGGAGGAQPGMLSRFMSNPNSGMMLQAGMGLVNGYMQGRAQDEEWDRIKPKGFYGVGLNGTPDRAGPMVPGGLMWNADSFRNPQARNAIGPNMAMEPGSQVDPYTGEVIADTPLPYDPQQGAPTRGRI